MRNFSMVSPFLWRSKRVKELSSEGKVAFLYLLTCEHQTMVGAYRLPPKYGACDLQWEVKDFERALNELLSVGLVLYDFETDEVMITGWFKFNPPNGTKTLKGMENALEKIESETLREAGVSDLVDAIQIAERKSASTSPKKSDVAIASKRSQMSPDQLLELKERERQSSVNGVSKGY